VRPFTGLQTFSSTPSASHAIAAHVIYRIARVRLYANMMVMATTYEETDVYRFKLIPEIKILREEYSTLLYGRCLIGKSPL